MEELLKGDFVRAAVAVVAFLMLIVSLGFRAAGERGEAGIRSRQSPGSKR